MKTNELMIGSLVRLADDYYDIPKGTMFKVVEIYADTIFAKDIEGAYEGMELPEYKLEPIPLTLEIMEKNGFVYNDLPFEQSWQQFGLSLYRGGGGYHINCGENVTMIIGYVHQLQHALRLCGIEKEIIL